MSIKNRLKISRTNDISIKIGLKISRYVVNSIKTMLKSKHDSYWQSKRAPAYKYSKLALDYLSYLICPSTPSIPKILSVPKIPNPLSYQNPVL
jgi:hypothetical protein